MSGASRTMDRLAHTREGRRLLVMLAVSALFIAAVFALPVLLPFDPNVSNLSESLLAPGVNGHVAGTDSVGRDVLNRTLAGGTESVLTAFLVVLASFALGSLVGLVGGFAGGAADGVLDKVITIFQAFPSFVLAIALAAILGEGTANMVVAITATYWTYFARLARGLAVSFKGSDCVRAARVCGAPTWAIVTKYLLPSALPSLLVMCAVSMGDIVLTMAGLSFLGLGPARPTNEWGAMISEARSTFQFAPWGIVAPGVALLISVTVFNLLGDALRDFLDVRTACAEERDVLTVASGASGEASQESR